MATEYKLSYTASEIDEKLTNVDVLESRIAALESNGSINALPSPVNIYTFLDAYVAWCNGETFPIAFYGDSTFYGTNTKR